jgi:phosphoribosylanthranilate isomerase
VSNPNNSSNSSKRTRIKICGITRADDLRVAIELDVDALGFVFYPPSPRFLETEQASELVRAVPPFVTTVGLFVNAPAAAVYSVLETVPLQLLQFHGEEDAAYCRQFGRPYIKAARVRPGFDLVEYAALFPNAQGLLLDTYVDGYGGVGQRFDWRLVPPALPLPVILSDGLDASNVEAAIHSVRPWAVDVSSGVESAKGVKDAAKMAAFITGVRNADA